MRSLTACHGFGVGRILGCHGTPLGQRPTCHSVGAVLSACEVQNGRLGKLIDLFSELAGRWSFLGTQGFALRDSTFCESSSPLR